MVYDCGSSVGMGNIFAFAGVKKHKYYVQNRHVDSLNFALCVRQNAGLLGRIIIHTGSTNQSFYMITYYCDSTDQHLREKLRITVIIL